MRRRRDFDETFERNGREFGLNVNFDDSMGPPWEEHDGHGVVSEWTTRNKRSGELVLVQDRSSKRYYDFAESTKIAKKDGWGLGQEDEAELAQKLGRAPTQREIVREAVMHDYNFLRGWCNDEWHWVWVLVTHIESGETESLGGIEDSDYRYIREVRDELADIINGRLDDEMAEEIEESRPDMRCMPDPDQIAIPPYLDCDHN